MNGVVKNIRWGSVLGLLLLLLRLICDFERNLLQSDFTHFEAEASKEFVFGFFLINLISRLYVDDGLGVFVNDFYQFN